MRRSPLSGPAFVAVEDYLANERAAKVKHEYVAGEVHAMSPQSKTHSRIILNIAVRLHEATLRSSCRLYNDIRVQVAGDRYYYADVVIECGPPGGDEDQVEVPCFVVEVTSPSTRPTDLREKAVAYRDVPSVHGYLIAEQRRRRVIMYTRASATEWTKVELSGDGTVTVPCIDASLSLDDIYAGLELAPIGAGEGDEVYTIEAD